MRVVLRDNWFGPSDPMPRLDGTVITGTRYRRGERELPDWLFPFLPKDTIVIEGPDEGKPFVEKVQEDYQSLRDYDVERASMEAEAKIRNKVQADQDRLKKMNEGRARAKAAREAVLSAIKEQ